VRGCKGTAADEKDEGTSTWVYWKWRNEKRRMILVRETGCEKRKYGKS
jgi:hypothetical protein